MAVDNSPEKPLPVRALNQLVSGWVDRLGVVWVEGQVTQISRRGGMNTVFMTLRDRLAEVSVALTCPRGVIDALPSPLVDGAQIVVQAKPDFYAPRGSFSMQVREIRLVGEGALLARLEQRRQLLAAEGLFDASLKRPLPFLPRSIGLVTAQGSAAEKDVLENVRRRWPGAHFTIRHAAMQGQRCAVEVIEATTALDADPSVEVIVIARGGGSLEDLLPFSDEALMRHVHGLTTPVVSAIGHEQDSPILDLVADHRASTPTDAAKLVAPDVAEEAQRLAQARVRARRAVLHLIEREQHTLAALRARPVLADPRASVDVHLREVRDLRSRLRREFERRVTAMTADLDLQIARVRALSPVSTLNRGYAIVADESGTALTSVSDVGPRATIRIRLADGRITAITDTVEQLTTTPQEHEDADE